VRIFGPTDSKDQIEGTVNAAFRENGGRTPTNHGQFSSSRYAFLFKPGIYDVDLPVGYYTQILGLGRNPDEVIFNSSRGIYCKEGDKKSIFGSLSTFWRGAENFRRHGSMLWATSQATPLRRAIIDGDLELAEYTRHVGEGYSSGGFVGNVRVSGKMKALSQQQYCTRNAELAGGTMGGVWNMVYVGTMGAPETGCGPNQQNVAVVTVPVTPRIAEKPFISIDAAGRYSLHIPRFSHNRVGPDFSWGEVVDFEHVFVANASVTAATINTQLRQGFHVVLAAGMYHLEDTLELNRHGQVLLGIGLPTLVAAEGVPAIRVGNVDGVRIAGILVEAGTGGKREALFEWGEGTYKGNPKAPGLMHDVFIRVGGTNDPVHAQAKSRIMMRIASGNVIGDNLWLWRADHGVSGIVKSEMNPCDTGLEVTGGNVTMYGLAVEHTLKDLVNWSGNNGETYFYQSELPYDVTQAYGDNGYVGYRVHDDVITHKAFGVGVYHYFRDHAVHVQSGIAVPAWLLNSFVAPLSVYLSGKGEMQHVINNYGVETSSRTDQAKWFCKKGPKVPPPTTTVTATTTTTKTRTGTKTSTTTWTRTMTTSKTVTSTTRTTTSTTRTMTSTTFTGTITSSTTTTTSSSSTTQTQTITRSSTTTSVTSTTTTTTTTSPGPWWIMFSSPPQVGSLGFTAFLAGVGLLNLCFIYVLVNHACCRRRRVPQEPRVPVSRLLSILGSPQSGVLSPMSSIFGGASPGPFSNSPRQDAARTVSVDANNTYARRSLESQFWLPSSRVSDTPGRPKMTSRLFSMTSMNESAYSMSPRGNALLASWVSRSP